MVVVTAPVSVPLLAAALIVGSAAAIGAGIGDVYDSRQAGDSWTQSVANGAGTAALGLAIVDTLGAACEALCAPSVVTGGGGGGGDEPPGNQAGAARGAGQGRGGASPGNATRVQGDSENPASRSGRYPGGAEDAGPGAWGSASESMSARAAAYQEQITGRAAGSVYRVNGVKFDGYSDGVLQDAKGPGYANFVKDGTFEPWYSGSADLVAQAQRQLAAAGGTPIEWSVAEPEAAVAIRNLLASEGISGIKVVNVPAR